MASTRTFITMAEQAEYWNGEATKLLVARGHDGDGHGLVSAFLAATDRLGEADCLCGEVIKAERPS
jgi:hypothetical protein